MPFDGAASVHPFMPEMPTTRIEGQDPEIADDPISTLENDKQKQTQKQSKQSSPDSPLEDDSDQLDHQLEPQLRFRHLESFPAPPQGQYSLASPSSITSTPLTHTIPGTPISAVEHPLSSRKRTPSPTLRIGHHSKRHSVSSSNNHQSIPSQPLVKNQHRTSSSLESSLAALSISQITTSSRPPVIMPSQVLASAGPPTSKPPNSPIPVAGSESGVNSALSSTSALQFDFDHPDHEISSSSPVDRELIFRHPRTSSITSNLSVSPTLNSLDSQVPTGTNFFSKSLVGHSLNATLLSSTLTSPQKLKLTLNTSPESASTTTSTPLEESKLAVNNSNNSSDSPLASTLPFATAP